MDAAFSSSRLGESKQKERMALARRSAVRCGAGGCLAFLAALLVARFGPEVLPTSDVQGAPFAVAVGLALVGLGVSAKAVRDASIAQSKYGTIGAVLGVVANYAMVWFGAFAVLVSTMQFTRGRQLRRFGRVLLPKVGPGARWAAPIAAPRSVAELDAETRSALARQWRENGRTEHASVAAFARLTLDLMALGAPPALIARANEDGLDEIRHAQACFALARAIDGEAAGPLPFAEAARARTLPAMRTLALAALAVDSLVDGALHEGVSARIIAKLARRAADPVIVQLLKDIAVDEGRHARHGWDVVKWCLEEGGDVVASALEGAIGRLPSAMESAIPDAALAGQWEVYGLMGQALEAAEYDAGRRDLVTRTKSLLAARADRRAA